MDKVLKKIRQELAAASDKKTLESGQRYFKEHVSMYGVKSQAVRGIARENFLLVKGESKSDIFSICDSLWRSGMMEESFIACGWSHAMHKQYTPEDFLIFDRWVKSYVSNWASCDTLCNHTVGDFIQMFPDHLSELKRWASSENRWVRRASAVSLIIPARKGKFLADIFEIADILLEDRDDMVQKGYGWMLKVASQAHQQEVYDYVIRNRAVMPRTALRYAIEKMPPSLRIKAMER